MCIISGILGYTVCKCVQLCLYSAANNTAGKHMVSEKSIPFRFAWQGRIQVGADSAPAPLLTTKSCKFSLFWGHISQFSLNFDTRPPLFANPASGPAWYSDSIPTALDKVGPKSMDLDYSIPYHMSMYFMYFDTTVELELETNFVFLVVCKLGHSAKVTNSSCYVTTSVAY